jgi:tetratricopeptide (TPR) repeat protein
MEKINLKCKFLIMLTITCITVFLTGCSPDYIKQQGKQAYRQGDYLYSIGAFKLLLETQPDNPEAYDWIGYNYSTAGDYDAAIINYKKAIELGQQNTTYKIDPGIYYIELAEAYFNNGNYQEAAKTLRKLNEVNPDKCVASGIYTCTRIYDYAGQVKDAIDLQNRYPYSGNDISRKYRIQSYLNLRNHSYDDAIKLASMSIEGYPDNEFAYYQIGIALGEKGQYEKAVNALRKAAGITVSSYEEYLPIYISLAYYLTKAGQYDAAITAYNDAIIKAYIPTQDKRYSNFKSQMIIALTYYNMGKYDEALKTINDYIYKTEIAGIGITIRDSYYLKSSFDNYSYVFSVMPDSPAEKADFQFGDRIIAVNGESVKGKPVEYIVSQLRGTDGTEVTIKVQRLKNPFKKADDSIIIEKKLVREPVIKKLYRDNLADIYGIRSLVYRAKGQKEGAQVSAETAIEYNPESFNAKLAWGLANIDMGKYNDALKILSSTKLPETERLYLYDGIYYLFTPFPSDQELVKFGKAIAYLKLGRINEAISYIPADEIAASSSPIYKEYQVLATELDKLAQSHNEKAANLYKRGFLREALNEYTLALTYINNDQKEAEIRNNLINLLQEYPVNLPVSEEARKYLVRSEFLLKQGDIAGSLNECRKGLKLAPYEPKFYYNVAELNAGLGNFDKAIKFMNIYIKLAPNASDIQNAKDDITKWELMQERK